MTLKVPSRYLAGAIAVFGNLVLGVTVKAMTLSSLMSLDLEAAPADPLAQVDPNQNRFPPSELPPTPVNEDSTPPLTTPLELPDADSETEFRVTDIQVVGSTLFDNATLAAIVAPYENQDATLNDLQQAANAITQLYLADGYITSRAVIEPQTLVDGIVQIQVIEGELEAIDIEGTDTLQAYIRNRVALGGIRPLNQARLEDQLRLLRLDPLFATVEASLRAGSGVGKSRLIVRVSEAEPFSGSIFSDSYSPPAVGNVRVGARLEYRNLAGLGDTLFGSATWTTTAGSKVYELGYRVPVNPMNGTITARLTPNNFRITDRDQPTFALDTEGSTDIYEITFRQPLRRTPREELALSVGYRYRDGSTLISGVITDDTTIHAFNVGQDYIRRGAQGAWALQSQFRFGEELTNATVLSSSGRQDFFSWVGQLQRVQRLNADHLLLFQSSIQLSPSTLPGSEQFFVGGGLSVRGYDPNQRFGDSGIRFSLEDQIVITRDDNGLPFFQIAPFLDGGYVWLTDMANQTTDNNFLLGIGMGLLFNMGEDFNARADLAYPLMDIAELSTDDPRGLQFSFSLGYQF
ncbi:MAG: ShlB/FhaC/HecB family hemolysin secretion/activation protein [Cyanobacteria bacterium J06638_28]